MSTLDERAWSHVQTGECEVCKETDWETCPLDDAGVCSDCGEESRECDCPRYEDDDQRLGGHDD